jgi:cysteine desulfurase
MAARSPSPRSAEPRRTGIPAMPAVAYLDWNATAPLSPAARDALLASLGQVGNPSSVHAFGRAARRVVEDARVAVAALVGADPDGVIFTSGGTEANALALAGARCAVAVSDVEHASVLAAREDAARVPVDGDGRVAVERLDALLRARGPALVSVMAANNETGTVQPIDAIAACVQAHGGILHCDAVQAAGRLPVDMARQGIGMLTLSAHKLGGATGVGALVVRGAARPGALIRGGGQEQGARAGTENVAGIAAFGAAARAAAAEQARAARVGALRDRMEDALCQAVPATRILARRAPRLPNTSCVALPGFDSATIVMAMDLAGIAISAGAACSSGKVRPSHVLAAMGVPADIAGAAVRVSLGSTTTEEEVDRFVRAWSSLATRRAAA